MQNKKKKIVILMGGRNSEHEVSLASGRNISKNLDSNKYEVFEVVLPKAKPKYGLVELKWLEEIVPDLVFIAMHGKYGEDGAIQGLLEFMGVRYTGSGVLASALGMDKVMFKRMVENLGFPMPKWQLYNGNIDIQLPVVIKPSQQGSSVGVTIVKDKAKLEAAITEAMKYGDEVIVEEFIEGVEVSCGVLEEAGVLKALPVIEIRPINEFFDYEAKYSDGKCEEIVPAGIKAEVTQEVQEKSMAIVKALGGSGYSRVDFIIRNNVPYVLEINTLPGMTPQSLLPKEALAAGINYSHLLDRIIEAGLK